MALKNLYRFSKTMPYTDKSALCVVLRYKALVYQYNCFYKSFAQILRTKLSPKGYPARNSIIIKTVILVALLSINFCWPGWIKKTVGEYNSILDIKVGEGRNDGVQRVYCGCTNGHIVEWSFNNRKNSWEMVDCGGSSTGFDRGIRSLCIGNGREDGLNRVYGVSTDGTIYEFTYMNHVWKMEKLDSLGFIYTGVTVGKARNDNSDHLYIGSFGKHVFEYIWNGSSWDKNDITQERTDIWPLAVAEGRNDGFERIYCPDWYGPFLREYSWNGLSYEEATINSSNMLLRVVIGQGRNDGINRIYASGFFGHINEFTYRSKGWERTDVNSNPPNWSIYGLCLGRTKSDGKIRLYSGAQYGEVHEHSWNGSSWSNSVVDAITQATAYLAVGRGRNDDTARIYASGENNQLYEFTNSSPFVNDTISTFNKLHLFFLGNVIQYTLIKSGNVRIALYNVSGNEVCCLKDGFQSVGTYLINLPWKDKSKFTYPSGIYICGITFMKNYRKCVKITQMK